MPPNNIVLIGFMGAGKSAVGAELARILGRQFCDIDREIEDEFGMSISNIFATKGEAFFRDSEIKMCSRVALYENIVISTGGGCFLSAENAINLSKNGIVFYLQVAIDTALKRIHNDKCRPMLDGCDAENTARLLMARREPIYEHFADFIIDANGSIIETVNLILRDLSKVGEPIPV